MAQQFHAFANLIKSEAISSVQINIYHGEDMTFTNTFILQTIKLVAPNIIFPIIQHPCPQTSLLPCPFTIINKHHIKDKQNTYKLLLTLVQLSSLINQNSISNHISLLTLINMCQQICSITSMLNQHDLNPYYIFLNPLLKTRQYIRTNDFKRKIYNNTQYFNSDQQINIDYLIHKLNILQNYASKLQTQIKSMLQRKIIKIIILSFLKHLSVNSKKIHQVVLQQSYFAHNNDRVVEYMNNLNEYKEKLSTQKRQALGFYASFSLPSETQKTKQQQKPQVQGYELFNQRLFKNLVKPVSITAILLIFMNIF